MAIQIFGVTVLTLIVWFMGIYGQTLDVEIWNGQVTKKEMVDGHYVRSYECNCTESCSGSGSNRSCTRTCQTCYEDHYTRSYDGYSTVGNWTFDSIDTTSRSRRNSFPPPASYTNCKIGEPASRPHTYTNYVQAVPESLFHNIGKNKQYADSIPTYPKVYDFYKINRVLSVGAKVPGELTTKINAQLNEALKTLGAKKQVNVVVILTEIDDPSYRYAVENAWLGGEKNDVTVFVGLDGTTITWADAMTWALNKGNELFHVKLRDSVEGLGTLSPDTFAAVVTETIASHYDRPHMKDFEYLKDAIEPPAWVIILSIILAIGGSIGLSVLFHYKEVDDVIGNFFTGNKSRRRYYR